MASFSLAYSYTPGDFTQYSACGTNCTISFSGSTDASTLSITIGGVTYASTQPPSESFVEFDNANSPFSVNVFTEGVFFDKNGAQEFINFSIFSPTAGSPGQPITPIQNNDLIDANPQDGFFFGFDFGCNAGSCSYGGGYEELDFIVNSGVPEPSTWALMLVGFGGLGLSALLSAGKGRRATAAA